MKPDSSTQGLLNSPALGYASLRQEGLRCLERLAGDNWTDFNPHDPGITILEQYCYALTELAYRCDFPLPDLLSRDGKNPYASLFSPAQILASRPVTLLDLRKLALDVRGVKNAWIERWDTLAPQPYYLADGNPPLADRLLQLPEGEGAEAVRLRGLYRVLIEKSPTLGVSSEVLIGAVAERLHAQRPLGMDFAAFEVLAGQSVQVQACVEIESQAEPETVYTAILDKIAAYISPSVAFYTLEQRLAAGKTVDEVFDGPALQQGFIDDGELSALLRRSALKVSDLMREIMDVPGVALVTHLALSNGGSGWQDWWLGLDTGLAPAFDLEASSIRLERRQVEVGVNEAIVKARYQAAQSGLAYRPASREELDIVPPSGRDRQAGRYYSAQHQFPEVYGLGAIGLPPQADSERRGQLKQLQAYLLFFDQLLANQFAQLAHLGELLGFDEEYPTTCFAAELDDPDLQIDALWRNSAADRQSHLQQAVADPLQNPAAVPRNGLRKQRLLDHLLARHAEQYSDSARYAAAPAGNSAVYVQQNQKLARDKQAWLRCYPALSAGRGAAADALAKDSLSGLEQRLRHKLGLAQAQDPQERFYLVEHLLLRPVPADAGQSPLPLLAEARSADPYSLQISLVFPGAAGRFQESRFRRYVEQLLREDAPAHLSVYTVWLEAEAFARFEDAYGAWRDSQGSLRGGEIQRTHRGEAGNQGRSLLEFAYCDARDRLLALLGLGRPYPMADVPLQYPEWVAWGQAGKIKLLFSQPRVRYQLLDKDGQALAETIQAEGNGGRLELATPKISEDIRFTLKADNGLSVRLFQAIDIKVGLDAGLAASIANAEPLVPAAAEPGDARIADYGLAAQVQVQASQAGVDYRLVQVLAPGSQSADWVFQDTLSGEKLAVKYLSAVVRGDSHTITLLSQAMQEDSYLRVLAVKTFAPGDQQKTQNALLRIVLPLKLRANPALALAAAPALLGYGAAGKLSISGSQASAAYQVLIRPIQDSEFVRSKTAATPLLSIPGMAALWLAMPPNPTPDVAVVGAAVPGNGGALVLPCGSLQDDSLLVVRAGKSHQGRPAQPLVASSLQLAQAVAVLVRPNPGVALCLSRKDGAAAGGGLQKSVVYQVAGGQPGVFYHFRLAGGSSDLGLPVYFHKAGKGLGQLQVEVDFAVTGSVPTPPPEWECPADLAVDAKLSILAVKAQTGLDAAFERSVAALLAVG